jgi:pseudouridine-5'-phosphate glycosidase/pseudouridine kinase
MYSVRRYIDHDYLVTLDAASKLNLQSGIFFGAPIPEKYAEAGALIQSAVERAIKESEENGVSRSGRDTTPWLLRRVGELTDGKAVESSKQATSLVS